MDYKLLIKKALAARKAAYAPYSNFTVGAALLTKDGQIFTGCNVESATFTPGTCAERTAIFTAVAQGARDFEAVAVVGGKADADKLDYCAPCGVCRQMLAEFCLPAEFAILIAKSESEYIVKSLAELLPMSFGPEKLR
ncbi:MAG: cytidine deaminase [Clostridiales bacterium]|nr:cytidine deaminase [Clostridiales bacterium]